MDQSWNPDQTWQTGNAIILAAAAAAAAAVHDDV